MSLTIMPALSFLLHLALAVLLMIAALSDWRTRTIQNWLTLSIAALAPVLWLVTGMSLWPDIALQIALGLGCLILFMFAFAANVMGGGDVKLIAALALWLPAEMLVSFLLLMSVLGGVLTIGLWLFEKARKSGAVIEVPYGIAIAAAALWSLHERYINPFW